ncbi:MAG: cation diffusion facilitator family transporter [Verrucomicrobiota bacterium]|jgi:cation diffusion facilitator family transporter|nr:cation diffusion facilitator family transporter [Verrucomicrobiota bacterium]
MSAENRITWLSVVVNILLTSIKLVAGIFGRSQALIADAVHSFSDFVTDFAVLVGLKMASKPQDTDHAYGHGKYETLAATVIGLALGYVAFQIAAAAIHRIFDALNGHAIPAPSVAAFWAALLSIATKEWLFHKTMRVAKATGSSALVANAWHHRSDALSSIATATGVGAAALLGRNWIILDPIAALFVSIFLFRMGWRILREQLGTLTDQSLPPALCRKILELARSVPGMSEPHNLRTRMVGRTVVIDLHVRLPGDLPLYEAHELATRLEKTFQQHFGKETIANIHLEPYPA